MSENSRVILTNDTHRSDKELWEYIKFVWPEGLGSDVSIWVSNRGFIYDQNDKVVYQDNIAWDGTAYQDNSIEVVLNERIANFPIIWWPDEKFEGNYIRGTFLENPTEYFVYSLAHELRH